MPTKKVTVHYTNNDIDQMIVMVIKRKKKKLHGKTQSIYAVGKDAVSGNFLVDIDVPNAGGNTVFMVKILGIKSAARKVLSLYTRRVRN